MADALSNLVDLRAAGAAMPQAVAAIVVAALNFRRKPVDERLAPLVDLLLAATQGEAPALSVGELREGALALARSLHNLADDMPKVGGTDAWDPPPCRPE